MKTSLYTRDQYIDAPSLNNMATLVSGDIAQLCSGIAMPGITHPEAATFAFSGLTVTATLNSPFAVSFAGGVQAFAHGTQTNADTQSYAVSFSGVVPGSGSVTAYLIASYISIQQGAYTVVGPPPGHPDYDPTFAPYTAYSTQADFLSLAASTTPPDNLTTFEIGRTSLAAGASAIASLTTNYQVRGAPIGFTPALSTSGSVALTAQHIGKLLQASNAGDYTLPLVSGWNGAVFGIASTTSGAVNFKTTAPNLFYGYGTVPGTSTNSIAVASGQALIVQATVDHWQVIGGALTSLGGITSIVAGSGLSGGGASGVVTLTNTGVLQVNAGSGLSGGGAANLVTLNNTGVTSISASSGVTASSGVGAVGLSLTAIAASGILGNPTSGSAAPVATTIQALGGLLGSKFTSIDQTITSAGALTIAHGLAGIPQIVQLILVCQSADSNYSAGNLLFMGPATCDINPADSGHGISIVPDATNLNIRYASSTGVFRAVNKTTGDTGNLDNTKWKARFIAVYLQ